jgi:hypothetical protein
MGAVATPSELDRALTVLAYYGGNAARASKELGVPSSTLKLWKTQTHRERYLEIAEREGPRLEALAAAQARETIVRAGQAEHDLLDLLTARMAADDAPEPEQHDFPNESLYLLAYERWLKRGSSKELSELAGTVQRISTAKGINGTKLLELTGRPTVIHGIEDPIEAGKRLLQKHGITVDSTAEEVPNTPTQSLLAESGSANARESTVQTSASKPPD